MTSSTLTTTSFSSSTPFLPSSSATSSSNTIRRHLLPSSASTNAVFTSSSSTSLLLAKKEVDQARQFISQAERKVGKGENLKRQFISENQSLMAKLKIKGPITDLFQILSTVGKNFRKI